MDTINKYKIDEDTNGFALAASDNLACTEEHVRKMLAETELLKQLINYCHVREGATITITIEHDDGHKASATLYDHAALTQTLYIALEYFQSEVSV